MAKGSNDPIEQIWIYFAGPIVGAILAALVWPIFLCGD